MLPRLRGMFALAIWDARERCLFLARDPYGIKPLYYASTPAGFTFASQVKALLASRLVDTAPEPAGVAGFHLWGSVPEPWTLHRGVLQLPAGHWLKVPEVESGPRPAPVQWHDVREHWRGPGESLPTAALQARVRTQLLDTVAAHLVADAPVCIFLSGGVDSAALAALACELGVRPLGITLAFDEFRGRVDDETAGAAAVARACGMTHVVRRVTRAEFAADLPRLLAAMDQPTIDGVNTWFAAKAAAEHGYKVALSGVGGDELFCGYPSFHQLARAERAAALTRRVPGARTLVGHAARAWGAWRGQPKHALTGELMQSLEGLYFLRRGLFLPTELAGLMPADCVAQGLRRLDGAMLGLAPAAARDTLAGVSALESTHYLRNQLLRDSDWASMAHGVELRTPLVDVRLLAALAPCGAAFAAGAGKRLQAAAPAPPLPRLVSERPKTGFGLPMAAWLGDALPGSPPAAVTSPRSHWSRRWAWQVMHAYGQCA
jgi:asparagine synthase (glutamine-hydrolysing)